MKDIARELLKVAREIMADRLKDEIGIDGRTLFKATQENLDNWLDQNDYFEAEVNIDYETTFSGRYWRGNYDNPPEYPDMELEMTEADVVLNSNKPMPLRVLVFRILDDLGSEIDQRQVLKSRAAMKTIKVAIDKWSMDLEDVPVNRDEREMYPLPDKMLTINADLQGNRVIFKESSIAPDDLQEKTFEVANDDWDRWGDVPSDDRY